MRSSSTPRLTLSDAARSFKCSNVAGSTRQFSGTRAPVFGFLPAPARVPPLRETFCFFIKSSFAELGSKPQSASELVSVECFGGANAAKVKNFASLNHFDGNRSLKPALPAAIALGHGISAAKKLVRVAGLEGGVAGHEVNRVALLELCKTKIKESEGAPESANKGMGDRIDG